MWDIGTVTWLMGQSQKNRFRHIILTAGEKENSFELVLLTARTL